MQQFVLDEILNQLQLRRRTMIRETYGQTSSNLKPNHIMFIWTRLLIDIKISYTLSDIFGNLIENMGENPKI